VTIAESLSVDQLPGTAVGLTSTGHRAVHCCLLWCSTSFVLTADTWWDFL